MGGDDDFDRRVRRRNSLPRDLDSNLDIINRIIGEMSKEMVESMLKEFYPEEKIPDGKTNKKPGAFIYGYSMTVGPDGKTAIREFGNIKPSDLQNSLSSSKPPPEYKDEIEPLLDIISGNKTIRVLTELSGVEKNEIKLNCSEKKLTISINTPERRYHKEIELPAPVNPKVSKVTYKNGVLEVVLDKVGARKLPS